MATEECSPRGHMTKICLDVLRIRRDLRGLDGEMEHMVELLNKIPEVSNRERVSPSQLLPGVRADKPRRKDSTARLMDRPGKGPEDWRPPCLVSSTDFRWGSVAKNRPRRFLIRSSPSCRITWQV